MFFKKSEPKRWHPCLVLTIGTLAVVGAVTITNASKCAINNMKCKLKSFFTPKPRSDGDGENPFPARSALDLDED